MTPVYDTLRISGNLLIVVQPLHSGHSHDRVDASCCWWHFSLAVAIGRYSPFLTLRTTAGHVDVVKTIGCIFSFGESYMERPFDLFFCANGERRVMRKAITAVVSVRVCVT